MATRPQTSTAKRNGMIYCKLLSIIRAFRFRSSKKLSDFSTNELWDAAIDRCIYPSLSWRKMSQICHPCAVLPRPMCSGLHLKPRERKPGMECKGQAVAVVQVACSACSYCFLLLLLPIASSYCIRLLSNCFFREDSASRQGCLWKQSASLSNKSRSVPFAKSCSDDIQGVTWADSHRNLRCFRQHFGEKFACEFEPELDHRAHSSPSFCKILRIAR